MIAVYTRPKRPTSDQPHNDLCAHPPPLKRSQVHGTGCSRRTSSSAVQAAQSRERAAQSSPAAGEEPLEIQRPPGEGKGMSGAAVTGHALAGTGLI